MIPRSQCKDDAEYLECLREWFAGMALQGFLACGSQRNVAHAIETDANASMINDMEALRAATNEQIAYGCYRLADSMLQQRDK